MEVATNEKYEFKKVFINIHTAVYDTKQCSLPLSYNGRRNLF